MDPHACVIYIHVDVLKSERIDDKISEYFFLPNNVIIYLHLPSMISLLLTET